MTAVTMQMRGGLRLAVLTLIGGLFMSGTVRAEPVEVRVGPGQAFETPLAARDAIRTRRAAGEWIDADITVRIDPGVYELADPLAFAPGDGGGDRGSVTYLGGPGVVISGGRAIGGWRATTFNDRPAWVADLPDVSDGGWNFRMLLVDGIPAKRSRLPETGFDRFSGLPGMPADQEWNKGMNVAEFGQGKFDPNWKNPSDVDVVALHFWNESRLNVQTYDPATRRATFVANSVWRLTEGFDLGEPARYCIENVAEKVTEPGQWYLDRPAGKLYYLPKPGEVMGKTTVVAPRLDAAIRVDGTADQPVKNLRFSGLSITGTTWAFGPERTGSYQSAHEVPAAVTFAYATDCAFIDGSIRGCGTYAVEVKDGSAGIRITDNSFTDLGAGGVKLNHGTQGTVVDRNRMERLGRIFHSACGVWIGKSSGNVVSRNLIADLYYTAVSVGWTWGYELPSAARDNRIEFNLLHTIGQGVLSDMGGVYMLGVSPGTVVRGNRIHDVSGAKYGGWGLYTDEGSSEILIEKNVVFRTTEGGFNQHYGKDNLVRNNIFAFSTHGQVARGRDEEHKSFTFERNIVLFDQGKLLDGNWGKGTTVIDRNLYWNVNGGAFDFMGMDLAAWQAKGHDRESVIADPMFVDPHTGDFRLKDGSPAAKIGFDPSDMPLAPTE